MPESFIEHIHSDYLDHGILRLSRPLFVMWDITNYCNLNCRYCSASSKYHHDSFIDNQNAELIADRLIDIDVKYVSIRGGEPTLVKQLPKIITKLVSAGMFVEVTSNGFGYNDSFFETISECNKNKIRLKISLDSPYPEINDAIRGQNSYKNATSAMTNCQKYGWKYRVQMAVLYQNKGHISDMYEFVSSNNADSFAINIVVPYGRGQQCERLNLDEIILTQIIQILKKKGKTRFERFSLGLDDFNYYPYINLNSIDDVSSKKLSIMKCNGGKTRINIDENGDCYPCELMKYSEFKMGNILASAFPDIWNSPSIDLFNSMHRFNKPKCNNCQYKLCNTGCLAMSYKPGLDINNLSPNCEL